jgi:hypothetical protein
MITTISMLACGDMNIHLSAGENALIISVISGWVISIVLAIVNLCLIIVLDSSSRFKVTNIGFLLIYAYLAFALFSVFSGRLMNIFSSSSWAIPVLIFGIPVLVIGHFVYLFFVRRKPLGKQHLEGKPTNRSPVAEQPQAIQPPSLSAGVTADERLAPLVKKIKDHPNA